MCLLMALGRAYNTFPLMNDQLIPLSEIFTIEPLWRNFFENTATVQVCFVVLHVWKNNLQSDQTLLCLETV